MTKFHSFLQSSEKHGDIRKIRKRLSKLGNYKSKKSIIQINSLQTPIYNKQNMEELAARLILEIFKGTGKGFSWIKNKAELSLSAKAYAKKLYKRYNYIRIFGMKDEVPLRSLFVRINILEKLTITDRHSIEALENAFDFTNRSFSFGTKKETFPATRVLNKYQKFIVLGKPGAGKTTLLKYYVLQCLDGKTDEQKLPIFISLKAFSDSKLSLLQYIEGEFDTCNFPNASEFIERLLQSGKCTLLLDGLDEVQEEDKNRVIGEMIRLTEKYDQNQFVISCRIAAYHDYFTRFKNVEVADFKDDQIELFIKNWFSKDHRVAKDCWEKLQKTPQVKELASVPLLLTLLCISFEELMDFPPNRAEIYEEAINALLKKWDSSRRIRRSEIYKGLSPKVKTQLLASVAYHSFKEGEYFMPQKRVNQLIGDYIEDLPEIETHKIHIESQHVLKNIESQHGILMERSYRIYSFSHLTFQEYFTAKYIVDNAVDGTLEDLVEHHVLDAKWREVVLLVGSMLPRADSFFKLIYNSITKEVSTNCFIHDILYEFSILTVNKNRKIKNRLSELAMVLILINHKQSTDNEEFFEVFSIIMQLVSKLDMINFIDFTPNETNEDTENNLNFNLKINPLHYSIYDFEDLKKIAEKNEINFSKLEIIVYLKYCEIIVTSLKSGAFVSKKTRKELMDGLLVLPKELE